MKQNYFFSIWLILLMLSGCSYLKGGLDSLKGGFGAFNPIDPATEIRDSNLVRISYKIADKLLLNTSVKLNLDQTILVASFVNVKNIGRVSNFGRVMAECITTNLVQKGYSVVEIKLKESVYLKEDAEEFLFSKNAKKMIAKHNARTIVVGTYARAREDIYISARLVTTNNNRIISACDFKLPLSKNLKALLDSQQNVTKISL